MFFSMPAVRMMKPMPFGGELVEHVARAALLFVVDLAGDADAVEAGHQDEVTAGDADVGGQRRALGADAFLDDLHKHFLAAPEDVLDERLGPAEAIASGVAPLRPAAAPAARTTTRTAAAIIATVVPAPRLRRLVAEFRLSGFESQFVLPRSRRALSRRPPCRRGRLEQVGILFGREGFVIGSLRTPAPKGESSSSAETAAAPRALRATASSSTRS